MMSAKLPHEFSMLPVVKGEAMGLSACGGNIGFVRLESKRPEAPACFLERRIRLKGEKSAKNGFYRGLESVRTP
jgi:hypothetical protein